MQLLLKTHHIVWVGGAKLQAGEQAILRNLKPHYFLGQIPMKGLNILTTGQIPYYICQLSYNGFAQWAFLEVEHYSESLQQLF